MLSKTISWRDRYKLGQISWAKRTIENIREWDKEYQREKRFLNPNKKAEENRNYRENNKEKIAAHRILNSAIKLGKIQRKSCESCGVERTHAHHTDYSQPLNVTWLCSSCHKIEHSRSAKISKINK